MSGEQKSIRLTINKQEYVYIVDIGKTLLEVIRDDAGLKGTKRGCDSGHCGACTVLLNGKPVNSCCVLAVQADGAEVTTIEGEAKINEISYLQESFVKNNAIQCGFCTPGMIMSARHLINVNNNPSEADIKKAMSGNICRCTGYVNIIRAIKEAAKHREGQNDE